MIPGLDDVSCYPDLLKAILDRGVAEEDLVKATGLNMQRVWKSVEAVRDEMAARGVLPIEEVWEGRKWWRCDGFYQMPDPDPEDLLGMGIYGVEQPEEGLYIDPAN